MNIKEVEAKIFFSSDIKEIRYIVLDSLNETVKNKRLLENAMINNPEMMEIKIRELLGKVRDAYVSEYIKGTTNKDVKEFVRNYFKNSENSIDYEIKHLNNELSNAQGIILKQRNKISTLQTGLTEENLRKIIDTKCRKKNGKINYSKLGKELGCSNHTAQRKCKSFQIT